jgi:hypothetical protein
MKDRRIVMRKQFLIPVLASLLALSAAEAFAQTATVVMRNGERVRADVRDMGRAFSFNVNGQSRSVPIGDVVMLDFTGDGRNVSAEEVAKVNAANGGYVVMRNGEQFNASLQDLMGNPLIALFYMGSVANVSGFPNSNPTTTPSASNPGNAPSNARSVVVPSNVQWTNTGFTVAQGQRLRFETSGEIRLSLNGEDTANGGGASSGRRADGATIPGIPVGALIGRVNNGQPFAIGNSTDAIVIPGTGRLFLGVNDDHVPDNSGNFVVRVWEP